jgi:DNA polymerase III epsilon subunit-like protein
MIALVFDWETTGLTLHADAPLDKQPRAIEFGGLLVRDDGSFVREFGTLINPGEPISEEITRITGITNAELAGAPRLRDVLDDIRSLFAEANCMIAHNLSFDRAILAHELARHSVTDWPWPAASICTVETYAPLWGRRPKLTELYQDVIGQPLAQTHRALDDVKALAQIIVKEGWL